MGRFVAIGGATTGEKYLNPIVEAAIAAGLANDGEVFTLGRATRSPEVLAKSIQGQLAAGHSLGNGAVGRVVGPGVKPRQIIAFNPTERTPVPESLNRVRQKGQQVREKRNPHYRAVRDHNVVQAVRHPLTNLGALIMMTQCSMAESLSTYDKLEVPCLVVVTDQDCMTPGGQELYADRDLLVLSGTHDEVLIRPGVVMRVVAERLNQQPDSSRVL